MPEFTMTDFVRWLKIAIVEDRPIVRVINDWYADSNDNDKTFRAIGAFHRWVAKGCKEE